MVGLRHYLPILAIDCVIHQAMDSKSICYDLTEYVAIIVLSSQQESALSPDQLPSHIIDVAMLIVQGAITEVLMVVILEHLLEKPLESPIVLPNHGLLRGKFHRQAMLQPKLEALVRKSSDRLLRIIDTHEDTSIIFISEAMNSLVPAHRPISRGESHLQSSTPSGSLIHTHVLVTKGVTTYNYLFVPVAHQLGNSLYYNWSIEHGPIQAMAYGRICRPPQPLQSELRLAGVSRCDGGTLDTNSVLLDGLKSV